MTNTGYTFTDRARQVLAKAREEADRLCREKVDTEHILLGLILEGEGVATAVLKNMSVDLADVRQRIEHWATKRKAHRTMGFRLIVLNWLVRRQGLRESRPALPFTSGAKKVLELAMREARDLKHSYIGTEHLLLGLLAGQKGVAANILTDAGVSLDAARAEVLRLLGSSNSSGGLSRSSDVLPYVSDLYWMTGVSALSRRLHSVLSDLTREAARGGREYFTPEELLSGIVRAGGAARVVIELLNADADHIVRQLEAKRQASGADPKRSEEPQVGPDSLMVRIFGQASTERRRIAEGAVGTDHVLLGILAEYRGPAYQVLADNGVGYEKASAVVERMSG